MAPSYFGLFRVLYTRLFTPQGHLLVVRLHPALVYIESSTITGSTSGAPASLPGPLSTDNSTVKRRGKQ
jgi:hypothetical protein